MIEIFSLNLNFLRERSPSLPPPSLPSLSLYRTPIPSLLSLENHLGCQQQFCPEQY